MHPEVILTEIGMTGPLARKRTRAARIHRSPGVAELSKWRVSGRADRGRMADLGRKQSRSADCTRTTRDCRGGSAWQCAGPLFFGGDFRRLDPIERTMPRAPYSP